jgi:hypothetical protein
MVAFIYEKNKYMDNRLLTDKHWLILFNSHFDNKDERIKIEIEYLKNNFCGNLIKSQDELNLIKNDFNPETIIYICGNIELILNNNKFNNQICIIKEISSNYDNSINLTNSNIEIIGLGMVPINIYGLGVYFRNFFDSIDKSGINTNYFNSIEKEHVFQDLTETNKQSNAFRKGIYITDVKHMDDTNLEFYLMRSSTNFNGPTDNFRITDKKIISKVNDEIEKFFETKINLNHVQAQIYYNYANGSDGFSNTNLERKAKIKTHSDKTEDMDEKGLIAFCSFYQNFVDNNFTNGKEKSISKSNVDLFDYTYGKNSTILTRLRFKLKKDVQANLNLVKSFDLVLYPNSLFVIGLETNRLYTHEIVPSNLFVDKIPTRLGYVIRCSKTKAIHKNNKTFIISPDSNLIELVNVDTGDKRIEELKEIYYKENMTSKKIIYGFNNFSVNNGDYLKPNI